jgi:hypothetical protein
MPTPFLGISQEYTWESTSYGRRKAFKFRNTRKLGCLQVFLELLRTLLVTFVLFGLFNFRMSDC